MLVGGLAASAPVVLAWVLQLGPLPAAPQARVPVQVLRTSIPIAAPHAIPRKLARELVVSMAAHRPRLAVVLSLVLPKPVAVLTLLPTPELARAALAQALILEQALQELQAAGQASLVI